MDREKTSPRSSNVITLTAGSDDYDLGHDAKNSQQYATHLLAEDIDSSFDWIGSRRTSLINSEALTDIPPMSASRLSMSALRLSLFSRPSTAASKSKSSKSLPLTDLLHDFLDTLVNSNDPTEKKYALDGLKCFLSTKRDTKYYENLEKQLKPLRINFTRELHLSGAIIGITRNVIAERKLLEAQKTYGFCREKYWAILVVQAIAMTITTKELSQPSRRDIQTQVTNLIESISREEIFKTDVEHVEASCQRDLSSNIITYLKFRVEHEELVDRLMKKDNAELNAFQAEHKNFLDSVAQPPRTVADLAVETHFIVIPEVKNQFISIETQTYVHGHIKQRLELYKEEITYFAPAKTDIDNKSNFQSLHLMLDLNDFLKKQLDDLEILIALDKKSDDQLCDFLEEEERKILIIEETFADIKEPSIYYEDVQYETQIAINQLSIGARKTGNLDSPALKVLMSQTLDLMLEDENKKNALDKAIESENLEIIVKVFAYASHLGYLDRLLLLTLTKIAKRADKARFLLLIACTCLFDPQTQGKNLFNPLYVNTIRQLSYENFSQNYFSTLFNQFNEPVLNSTELVQIARQLFDASSHFDDNTIIMPAVVWQALKERQLPHERFEKLAYFYKAAIVHVVKKCIDNPLEELYFTKKEIILNTLYRYAKTEYPLEVAVVYIANELVARNSILARRKPVCVSGPYVLNKTQRLIWQARESLPKKSSCPSLQLSPVDHATPAKKQIQEVFDKLQGTDQEQEERQKECVCKDLMEEKWSWLPSFWSRSTESSIEEYPPSFWSPSTWSPSTWSPSTEISTEESPTMYAIHAEVNEV